MPKCVVSLAKNKFICFSLLETVPILEKKIENDNYLLPKSVGGFFEVYLA